MRLEQDFATFRMGPTELVDKYITRVKTKAQELRAVGVEINAARISNTILGGLPKDYLPTGGYCYDNQTWELKGGGCHRCRVEL